MNKLLQIWKDNRQQLTVIYALIILAQLLLIALPNLLGKAIDDLLANSYNIIPLLKLYLITPVTNWKDLPTPIGWYPLIYLSAVILIGLFQ
jgi:hypothetical protein